MPDDAAIANAIRALLVKRGAGKSICPSEAARALGADWRALMPDVRRVAVDLPDVDITQKGVPVNRRTARGPVRLYFTHDPG